MALVLFCSLRPNEREQKRNESRIDLDLVFHARHAGHSSFGTTSHRPQDDPYPPVMQRFRQASDDQTVWSILVPDLRDREGIVASSSSFSFRRPGVETSGNLGVERQQCTSTGGEIRFLSLSKGGLA